MKPLQHATVLLAGVLVTGACTDLEVPDLNQTSVEDLRTSPTPAAVAAALRGQLFRSRNNAANHTVTLARFGREAVNLSAQNATQQIYLVGPLTPETFFIGPSLWQGPYRSIRTANEVLKALDVVTGMTSAEKEGARGLVKTFKALDFLALIVQRNTFGIPLQVDVDPSGPPPPIATKAEVYAHVFQLLDEGKTHLQAAGSSFFTELPGGFAGFDTPAAFVMVNRAIKARADVYQNNWNDALAALSESFLDVTAPFSTGLLHVYSLNSGDETNPLFLRASIWAHPTIRDLAQLRADGSMDLRAQTKVFTVPLASYLGSTSDIQFIQPDGPTAPHPIIRNEELILLRAEANLGLGNTSLAIQDINLIRVNAGGLAPIPDPFPGNLLDELLYNKRYSLLFEWGHTWIDARHYDKLGELPRVLPNHRIFDIIPFPDTECIARNPQPTGCTQVNGL